MTSQPSSLHYGADFDLAAIVPILDPPAVSSSTVIDRTTSLYRNPPRSTRPRAEKACLICRTRKVRCNVVEGKPCMNCKMDGVRCVVPKRTSYKPAIKSPINATMQYHEGSIYPKSKPDCSTASGVKSPISTMASPTLSFDGKSCIMQAGEMTGRVSSISPGVTTQLNQNNMQKLDSYEYQLDRSLLTPPSTELHFESQLRDYLVNATSVFMDSGSTCFIHSPSSTKYDSLPSYIQPLPEHMSADDIHFLWKKGALIVPKTALRNRLIQCYVEYVYPYMPAIELNKFLRIVSGRDGGTEKVSLLLFHAIMFAGTAFVDMAFLETAGYTTRMEARKAFYNRTKVIYNSNLETDSVALVQSLLLMTYWYESPDPKDPWHWVGIAISLAHSAGMHRNAKNLHMTLEKRRLSRRIWWSCYMRDRIVTLGTSRPTRIRDEEYDVPMLTLDDFEIEVFSGDSLGILSNCAFVGDRELQKDLALMCMEKVKLCMCISHVLSGYYSFVRDQDAAQGSQNQSHTDFLVFPEKMEQIKKIQVCEATLKVWVQSLPPRFAYVTASNDEAKTTGDLFIIHRSVLHLVYFATVSSLHRLLVLPSAGNLTLQKYVYYRKLLPMSYDMARTASFEISRICLDLQESNLEIFLPSYSLVALLPAIMVHLLDLKSFKNVALDKAVEGFYHCTQVLKKLRECYLAADYAGQFLKAAINASGVHIPSYVGPTNERAGHQGGARANSQDINHRTNARETQWPLELEFPAFDTLPENSYYGPNDDEEVGLCLQNTKCLNEISDLDEPQLMQNCDSIVGSFATHGMNGKNWESILDGVMNSEGGPLLVDTDWICNARDTQWPLELEFPAFDTLPENSYYGPNDDEEVGLCLQNTKCLNEISDLDEPQLTQNCDSIVGSFATHGMNGKNWESILDGVMNSEGGSLLADMNWI